MLARVVAGRQGFMSQAASHLRLSGSHRRLTNLRHAERWTGGRDDMKMNYHMADDDVFEQACLFVVASDVVSTPDKKKLLHRLATMKLSINCPRGRCGRCDSKRACEAFADSILAS